MDNSLCPHLLEIYFEKVHEVLVVYRTQICALEFEAISFRLVTRKVLTEQDHYDIISLTSNERGNELIKILHRRVRGLEHFIIILMEEKCDPWLAQELFNAYQRHVSSHIVRLKKSKSCQCLTEDSDGYFSSMVSSIKGHLGNVAEKVDNCVYSVGTSVGFMDQSIYPTENLLAFVNKRIPFLKPKPSFEQKNSSDQMSLLSTSHIAVNERSVMTKTIAWENEIKESEIRQNETEDICNLHVSDQDGFLNSSVRVSSIDEKLDALYDDLEWDNYDLKLSQKISSQVTGLEQSTQTVPSFIRENIKVAKRASASTIASAKKEGKGLFSMVFH